MNTLNYINHFRRSLFNNISTINKDCNNINCINAENISKILICRPNQRLGNLLLITPLIQEIEPVSPNAKKLYKGVLETIVTYKV